MSKVTAAVLGRVSTLPSATLAMHAHALGLALDAGGITNTQEVEMFVAQVAHESNRFRNMTEIWGPTAAQLRYEWSSGSKVSRWLGNTQPGDGFRFRGQGYIEITGRANFNRYGRLIGEPLEAHPELAAQPLVAGRVAVAYWQDKDCGPAARAGKFDLVTLKINGGYNGNDSRRLLYATIRGSVR